MPEQAIDREGDGLNTWLSQTEEEALDPEQPIIDPHHHLWDRRHAGDYHETAPTHSRYLGDDLIDDITRSGHNVIDTVFVECLSMYRVNGGVTAASGEIEFVQGVAAMAAANLYGKNLRCCSGIVGFADLTRGEQSDTALRSLMDSGRGFRGVRQAHGWHASPEVPSNHHPTHSIEGLLLRSDFRKGFGLLEELELRFDCWGYHTQLAEVADLARAFPAIPIVLNHLGGPIAIGPFLGQRETGVLDEWKRGIEAVSTCPNVTVKVGGCGMPIYGFGHEDRRQLPPDSETLAAAWKPTVAFAIEAFGPERSMFESNFPVDKVSCSYGCLWNAFKRLASELGLDSTEKNDLFYGTAARTYGLALPQPMNAAISSAASLPNRLR